MGRAESSSEGKEMPKLRENKTWKKSALRNWIFEMEFQAINRWDR